MYRRPAGASANELLNFQTIIGAVDATNSDGPTGIWLPPNISCRFPTPPGRSQLQRACDLSDRGREGHPGLIPLGITSDRASPAAWRKFGGDA